MDHHFEKIHLYLSGAKDITDDRFQKYVRDNILFLAANPNMDPTIFPVLQEHKNVLNNPRLPKDLFFQLYEKFGGLNTTTYYSRTDIMSIYNTSFTIEEILEYKDKVNWDWYKIQAFYPLTKELVLQHKELQGVHIYGNSSFTLSDITDMSLWTGHTSGSIELYISHNRNCTWEQADGSDRFMSNPNMTMDILRNNVATLIKGPYCTVNTSLDPEEMTLFFESMGLDICICVCMHPSITYEYIRKYPGNIDRAYLCENHFSKHNSLSHIL